MIPSSLSASSLNVAELCLARWKAENFHRSKGMGGSAANLGTSCHGALEMFIKHTRPELGGVPGNWDIKLLLDLYKLSYMDTFNTVDASGEIYDDGVAMLTRWYERQSLEGVVVLSTEKKDNFPIPTSAGEIPFNYIWDRFDQIGEREFKVVDYKTNRWGLNPGDLKKKIQARCYGLAAAIQLKAQGLEYDKIWVEFDLLRHDPVGIVYSHEENIATWTFIKNLAEKIIATPEDEAPETLNPECRFCVRKLECNALKRNVAAGGVFSVSSAQEAVDIRATLDYQAKAIQAAIVELDEIILTEAREKDVLSFESDMNKLDIGVSSRRAIDSERVQMVLGPELFDKYGSHSISMSNIDKLLKGKELDAEKKAQLKSLIFQKKGEPSVKVKPKNSLEDE